MARKFAAVVFSLGCLQASSVMALGLGELTLESFLNEPLKARVDLLNTSGLHQDEIRIRLATKEDFEKMGLSRAYFLTNIKFQVITDDRGRAQLVMSSDDPVLEPYLDFIVEARWPSGRLLREYTVLIDPPVFDQSSPAISASERVAEVEGLPAPVKKTEKSATGTHVDLKKSALAPGDMPQRGYNAEASPTPVAGSRYMIHRDDTLWEIALQAKPEGASVHQTMLDIQRINPGAFIDGNINRVKAGYIVYLPSSDDISSADMASAMAEVRQQNEDWREGRASQPVASSGPSLRISAEPEESGDSAGDQAAGQGDGGASVAAMEDLEKSELDRSEAEQRLVAMEQQVETLQRIVSLKDDQIAALQGALAEADGSTGTDEPLSVMDGELGAAIETETLDEEGVASVEEVVEEEPESAAASAPEEVAEPPAAKPAPVAPVAKQPQPQESGGFMSNNMYILGAAVLAILGFLFVRRRRADSEDTAAPAPAAAVAAADDAFADVQLKDQKLEVEAPVEPETSEEGAPLAEEEQPLQSRGSRGYGEHKHDEYASDVDTGDALAEADIYIAYGRYPQAIDLLNNAIGNEPGNPAYRLKLLEVHAEMGDRTAARQQFSELKSINDPASLARAQEVLDGLSGSSATVVEARTEDAPVDLLAADDDTLLEADFSGLEIEDATEPQSAADELDLSADFAESALTLDDEDGDLVIATESNGFSTKLDLARAYLDMGDDDGARQILEEVAADGSGEIKAEAQELLERIG